MKQFYITLLLFISLSLTLTAQTAPTGTSTEVGVTNGTLSVSLTGNATYTIPILVPPGINGVEPQISINYSSQRGLSGTAGKGWDIGGVSSITRIPATKFHDNKIDPVDFNSYDRFALDGQRLIVKNVNSVYGADATVYETEYFSNIKVTSYGVHPSGANYGPAYFKVEYPNGSKAYYGNSTDSRSVTEWSITNIDNPQGLRISYSYTTSNNSLYIASIKYGGLTSAAPINEVKFIYGPRAVIEDSYIGGVNIKRDKNLTEINVIGNGAGFRNYVFDNQNIFNSVTEKNGDKTKSYNPTVFTYGWGSTDLINYVKGTNTLDVGNIQSINAGTVSGDFDGDGNMDFLLYPTTGAAARAKYWLYADVDPNTPFSTSIPHNVGAFDEIFPVSYIDLGNRLASSQGWTVVQGSTFTTFFLSSTWGIIQNDQKGYNFPRFILDYQYECEGVNSQAKDNIQLQSVVEPDPTGPLTEHYESDIPRRFISGDFNGDGITDIVAIEKSFTYPYRYGCTTFTQTYQGGRSFFINLDKRVSANFVAGAGSLQSNDSSDIRVGDFNGDGKSDIFVFNAGIVKIFGLDDTLHFVLLYQKSDANIVLDRPLLMGDYNGDGKTEFILPKLYNTMDWYKFMSTGNSLVKEEKHGPTYQPNDSYNSFNYVSIDFNNDGKTDIIGSKSYRNTANTVGAIGINCYISHDGAFTPNPGYSSAYTTEQADINIYSLPVALPTYNQNIGSSTNKSTLQIAFLNQNKVHFFSSAGDAIKDNSLSSITTGNGVKELVSYVPLNSSYRNTYNSIYNPGLGLAVYPYQDIKTNPGLYVVSQIEQKSKDVSSRKRLFGYYGAVTNVEGLGFIGFRSVTQTNWHDDTARVFTDIYKNDINLRGANVESAKVSYLSYPSTSVLPSNFETKSIITYNIPPEVPLQSNKVFKLKTTNIQQFNTLNDTSSEIKDFVYDSDNNIKSSTIFSKNGGAVSKTVKTDIDYQAVITTPLYILGRPATKTETVTADGHTMTSKEVYTYDSQQLLSNTDKSATGTATISEGNEYDLYGNIIKKTITPPLPLLPRVTKYEYDATKRFVSKITDNDDLFSTFAYDANGLLKKETDPYLLSKSYTYDSWFQNLTIKDDQLDKIVTSTYTRSTEKTIVNTTVSASGLDTCVYEETFDDLGRKIKTGVKDLNGNMSYESYQYDLYDRNIKVSEPYFGVSPSEWNEVKFDDYGRNNQSILFNGRTTSTSYPVSSLKGIFTDGLKSKTIAKNAAGNTVSTDETTGGQILYNYFANGSLRKTSYNGVDIVMEQDGWGNKTKLTDPSAGTYRYSYNDLGELITETIDGTGITTTITRDKSGRPTKKTISGSGTSSETTYTYDGDLPLVTTYKDLNEPAATRTTTTTITYDASKRISSIVEDKTGVSKFTRIFTYDNLDRIVTETKKAEVSGKSSSVKTKNIYKNGSLHQIVLDDGTDKLLWKANDLNAKGQLKESETGNGIKATYDYNSDGYLSSIKYDKTTAPTGNVLTLTTNFNKNTDYLDKRINSAFGNYTETFFYDDIGRLKEFTNKLGVQETQTYDVSGKITGNNLGTYGYADSTKPYQNTAITLSPEATGYYSNREGIFNDSMEDKTGWGTQKYPNTNFFSYDLIKTPHAYGKSTLKLANTTSTEQYIFSDKWIDINNNAATQYTYSVWVYSDNPQSEIFLYMKDAANTVSQVNTVNNTKNAWTQITGTFSVPANIKKLCLRLDNNGLGNVWFDDVEIRKTSDPVVTTGRFLNIIYNAFKSPIQIEETAVDKISFTYNDDNQRSTMYYGGFQTVKTDRPLWKHYSADGSMEVKENKLTGAVEFITYIGDDGYAAPIAVKSDGSTPNFLYLHRDYQGTIMAITNSSGALVEKRLFDAWGTIIKVQDGAGNSLAGLTILDRGYTGHEHLQNVGLINMNARLYDPMLHRFLQSDNYVQDITSTQNYNQYSYVFNNPLLYTDPTGDIVSQGNGNGQDCVDCSTYGGIIGSALTTLQQNWDDWGIKDWANKNINGDKFSKWWKSKVSFNNMFGGGNKNDAPPPNLSKNVNIAQTGSGQYYGGDGSGSLLDYISRFVYETDQFNPIALAWDGIKGNVNGTDRYGNELSGFEANVKIVSAIPAGKTAGILTSVTERALLSEGKAAINGAFRGGKTFAQYKIARGGTETLAKITTSTGTQRISTEFHHVFLTQRVQRAYNLPNWMVNNRMNVWKVNTIQHSLIDPYRFKFLRVGIKQEVGWFAKYNWFTKF
ncbi:RHS repeat-associated core domain-containing protein [Flavobacterium humi]|uniref:Insecticide toxin TcdB middle/N-terminal domain-containing protein n=1 Tax=Flavobacterium humi TaxID=2562683 RepID=A0A4Z0LB53_9FLAO|nr:RHS repeat-associated core domain-containing protein [Flavobacterium humi]TGD58948.1 hypothetical protein E4635_03605 [Flavobacterium humi]